MINIIAAVAKNGVIGSNNTLPWYITEDLRHFRKLTKGHVVIMGRKTYEAMGKPLPKRFNIVVTSQKLEIRNPKSETQHTPAPTALKLRRIHPSHEGTTQNPELITVNSLDEAIQQAKKLQPTKDIWLIGGHGIFKEALDRNLVDQLYLTEIDKEFEGDIFFPTYNHNLWNLESSEKINTISGIQISFNKYIHKGNISA